MSKPPVKIIRSSYSDEYRRNAVSRVEDQRYTTAQAAVNWDQRESAASEVSKNGRFSW